MIFQFIITVNYSWSKQHRPRNDYDDLLMITMFVSLWLIHDLRLVLRPKLESLKAVQSLESKSSDRHSHTCTVASIALYTSRLYSANPCYSGDDRSRVSINTAFEMLDTILITFGKCFWFDSSVGCLTVSIEAFAQLNGVICITWCKCNFIWFEMFQGASQVLI